MDAGWVVHADLVSSTPTCMDFEVRGGFWCVREDCIDITAMPREVVSRFSVGARGGNGDLELFGEQLTYAGRTDGMCLAGKSSQ
jgi:hypothetical protein